MGVLKPLFPMGILMLILSMLVPLPGWVLDILLGANLLLALLLFLAALHVHNPLKLSSLPTILLIATLYRLVLNISTTRLILSGQDISAMIDSLGSLVMQGQVMVGIIIFAIVTLIQFVVIAKGAERVAEVSARFTLDALPGKQMSIDADIRAGMLDFEGAKKKRDELQLESRFYGALDGAMKFVKGDAIAGLCITLVNIIGGVLVGVTSHNMGVLEAGGHFSQLTVGDGLLSQIPALLNSLAAGMVVTRVVSRENASVADEIIFQLSELKLVRLGLGLCSVGMSFLEGMPMVPFLVCGLFLVVGVLPSAVGKQATDSEAQEFRPRIASIVSIRLPKTVNFSQEEARELSESIESLRQQVFQKWGLVLLPFEVVFGEEGETDGVIALRGITIRSFATEELSIERLMRDLHEVLEQHKTFLFDDAHTRRVLGFLEGESPELVSQTIPERIRLTDLTWILKRLLEEQVSISAIDLIVQAIAEAPDEASREQHLEKVRQALAPVISAAAAGAKGVIEGVTLPQQLEIELYRVVRADENASTTVVDDIVTALEDSDASERLNVIVCLPIRRFLFEVLSSKGLNHAVLHCDEVASGYDVRATPVGDQSVVSEADNASAALEVVQ